MGFFYSLRSTKLKKGGCKVEADGFTWSTNGKSNSPTISHNKLSKVPFVRLGKNKKKRDRNFTKKHEKDTSLPKPSNSNVNKLCTQFQHHWRSFHNDENDATIMSTGSAESYFDNLTISSLSSDDQDDRRDDRQEKSRHNGHRDVSPLARKSPADVNSDSGRKTSAVAETTRSAQPLKEIRRNASEFSKDYIHTFADQLRTLEEVIFEEDTYEGRHSSSGSWREDEFDNILKSHSFHDFHDEELIRCRWAASLKLMNR